MTYAIINVVNGAYSVFAEGITDLASAKVTFHSRCTVLWNAPDVSTAMVMIADENLDAVEGYKEYIHHDVVASAPVEEPTEEPTE